MKTSQFWSNYKDEGGCVPSSTQSHVSHLVPIDKRGLISNSKKLQFSLLNAQDTVKISEFEVTHRDLYTAIDRLPVKDGVLDRRLVRHLVCPMMRRTDAQFREQQTRVRFAKHAVNQP